MADNEMYRATDSNVVYYEQGGQRHWVLDPDTVESLGGWGLVRLRPPDQVNGIPAGDTWPSVISGRTVRDGYLLSSDASPEIDVMVQGRRCWVPDPPTFEANGFSWANVGRISAGQWNAIPAGPALQARHPIHVSTPAFDVGTGLAGGHFMQTVADIPDGQRTMYCSTRTWCTNWVVGFTGGVAAEFIDKDQHVLGATEVQAYGVDALGVFWKSHDRVDRWTWPVPDGTAAIRVYHKWAPRDRWAEDMAAFQQLIDTIARGYTTVADFLAANQGAGDYSTQSEA